MWDPPKAAFTLGVIAFVASVVTAVIMDVDMSPGFVAAFMLILLGLISLIEE